MRVVACWSGGKESCLACYKAILDGFQVTHLLNMISEDEGRSRSHGLNPALIAAQSQAIGIPLVQRVASWGTYEAEFKSTIRRLKQKGVSGVVFGDIYVREHREWAHRISEELGVEPILPLWGRDRKDLLVEFINAGFKAILVRARADVLGEKWLGRELDGSFLADLLKLGKVDPCGELGEYHTLVIGGPLFKREIRVLEARKMIRAGYWSLDILRWEVR